MVARRDGGTGALQIRLPRLNNLVAMSKDGIEGEIAHRDAFDLGVLAEPGLVEIEQMADESTIVGVTVDDKNTHRKVPSEVDLGP